MVDSVGIVSNITPNYNLSFRSNSNFNTGLDYVPKFRSPLTSDVFIKTTGGSINGSKDTISLIEKFFPEAKVKAFTPNQREAERKKKIENEKKHISSVITKRTEYNTRQLRSAGVSEHDVKKYLKIDGHVTEEGKRILREKGKNYQ